LPESDRAVILAYVANLLNTAKAAGRLPHSKKSTLRIEVEGALLVQKSQVAEDVGLDFFWLGFRVNLLQLADDLLHGVFAIAALDDFETRAIEAQCAFWHEQGALLLIFAQTNARHELWMRLEVGSHVLFSLGRKAPGGGQAGFT